ncbi:hypothetical protein GE253_22835 [Niveispirillum sp. SYP-B3756]|uniref:hypothetical protein n=1 Tax=Niveispirillum sp. SYP-B3756 TaxID=2662178 RepID=UPI0012918303|nr:hypothetical protein [Niveispirillum sp. SYP-B3756]MQP68158.1 hypothetical protein [Niveispirillum sp. SYP-B3756]
MNMCKRWKQRSAGLALALIAATTACADEASGPEQAAELPAAITRLREHGAVVIEIGKAAGVRSWVAIGKAGNVQIFHSTPEGGLIAGLLFDEAGRNISKRQMEGLKRENLPDQVRAALGLDLAERGSGQTIGHAHIDAQFADILRDLGWVPLGTGMPVYLFADMNCGHCHALWAKLSPAVQSGRIQLRVIPIVIRPDPSRMRARALLSLEKSGLTAEKFDEVLNQIQSDPPLPAGAAAEIDALLEVNLAAFKLLRVEGTPTIVYVDQHDGIQVIYAPQEDEVAQLMAEIPEGK